MYHKQKILCTCETETKLYTNNKYGRENASRIDGIFGQVSE